MTDTKRFSITIYLQILHITRRDFIMKHVSHHQTHTHTHTHTHSRHVNINMTSCQSPSRGNGADQ